MTLNSCFIYFLDGIFLSDLILVNTKSNMWLVACQQFSQSENKLAVD